MKHFQPSKNLVPTPFPLATRYKFAAGSGGEDPEYQVGVKQSGRLRQSRLFTLHYNSNIEVCRHRRLFPLRLYFIAIFFAQPVFD